MPPRLLIRADASPEVGTGHVMRCLALAQAWQECGGQAIFTLATKASALEKRLGAEAMDIVPIAGAPGSVEDAAQTAALAREAGVAWVLIDGYQFDGAYQQSIKGTGVSLLALDDYGHAGHYYADLVLNQNIYAQESIYASREPYTELLLGTHYALLRREFWPWRNQERIQPAAARKILITMGGGGSDGATLKVVQALAEITSSDVEACVIVGGSSLEYEQCRAAVRKARLAATVRRDVADMAEAMAWADVAVSAGGSTCWELAFMKVPNMIIVLADNQRDIAAGLEKEGVSINLGWHRNVAVREVGRAIDALLCDADQRAEMVRRGRQLVDGDGGHRVCRKMKSLSFSLRPAVDKDAELLWRWANDQEVRRQSFTPNRILWEDHVKWFEGKLKAPNSLIFIGQDHAGSPVGQVCFETEGAQTVIGVSVDHTMRGRGYGFLLIEQGVAAIFRKTDVQTVHAYIKPENRSSVTAFERAGFKINGRHPVQGVTAVHYVRTRPGSEHEAQH